MAQYKVGQKGSWNVLMYFIKIALLITVITTLQDILITYIILL